LFEFAEAALDEMALGVEVSIERVFYRSRGNVRNDGRSLFCGDQSPEGIGIIGCVGGRVPLTLA
jgi:hypothetical protein